MTNPYNQIRQGDLDNKFLTGPGEPLVRNLLCQMARVPGFIKLFGPYKPQSEKNNNDDQAWADYERMDWSTRRLPAINIFEAESEGKLSENSFLDGTITMQVFWPANFRRADNRRVAVAFKGAVQNFMGSLLAQEMLDELYWIQRDAKVPGLNKIGNELNWIPNAQGIIENELVPVTVINVPYRIDLRAYYRSLEYEGRTKEKPFEITLADLTHIGDPLSVIDSAYIGIDNEGAEHVEIPVEIEVQNP